MDIYPKLAQTLFKISDQVADRFYYESISSTCVYHCARLMHHPMKWLHPLVWIATYPTLFKQEFILPYVTSKFGKPIKKIETVWCDKTNLRWHLLLCSKRAFGKLLVRAGAVQVAAFLPGVCLVFTLRIKQRVWILCRMRGAIRQIWLDKPRNGPTWWSTCATKLPHPKWLLLVVFNLVMCHWSCYLCKHCRVL